MHYSSVGHCEVIRVDSQVAVGVHSEQAIEANGASSSRDGELVGADIDTTVTSNSESVVINGQGSIHAANSEYVGAHLNGIGHGVGADNLAAGREGRGRN